MADSKSMEESVTSSLIPGLSDDVAMLCLARLPFAHYPLLSCICRSWRRALQLPLLFSIRARLGLQEHFLFVVGSVHEEVPEEEAWIMAGVPVPFVPVCYLINCRLAKCYPLTLSARVLDSLDSLFPAFLDFDMIALGRQVLTLWQSRDPESHCFDVSQLGCTRSPPMLESRSLFASAAMDGYVYAAGGRNSHRHVLKSAERFNLASKKWERIADMTERTECASGFAWKGSFCLFGGWNEVGLFTSQNSARVWDALKEEWQLIPGFFPNGIRSAASVKGKLYALKYEHGEYEVMWLDEKTKHWIPLESLKGVLQGRHVSKEIFGVGDELWLLAGKSTFLATDPESLPLFWRSSDSLVSWINFSVRKFCVVTL